MAGKQRAGKNSRIRVGTTNLNYANWDTDWQGANLDTTNFESGGCEEGIIGIEVIVFNFDGAWDAGANPYGSPPGIYPRSDGPSVQFFFNIADNLGWTLPAVRFLSTKNAAPVRDLVTFAASGRSNGSQFFVSTTSV